LVHTDSLDLPLPLFLLLPDGLLGGNTKVAVQLGWSKGRTRAGRATIRATPSGLLRGRLLDMLLRLDLGFVVYLVFEPSSGVEKCSLGRLRRHRCTILVRVHWRLWACSQGHLLFGAPSSGCR
jgi:hypothetical protein